MHIMYRVDVILLCMYTCFVFTPIMRKLSNRSILVRLNFDFPEFCMSFVSLPAKITIP